MPVRISDLVEKVRLVPAQKSMLEVVQLFLADP